MIHILDTNNANPKLTISSLGSIRIKLPKTLLPDERKKVLKMFTHIINDIGVVKYTLRGYYRGVGVSMRKADRTHIVSYKEIDGEIN